MNSEKLSAYLPFALGLLVTIAAVYGLYALAADVHYRDILHELHGLSLNQMLLAALFVVLSFVALALTEIVSLRLAGVKQPPLRAATVSFLSQSIVHTTGFGIILGTSLRYRLYARYGLTLADVTKAQLFFSSGFALATLALLAGALILAPLDMVVRIGGTEMMWQLIGTGLMLFFALLLLWCLSQRSITLFKHTFTPPPPLASLPLIILSAADLLACCAIIYVLLPVGLDQTYPAVLVAFLAAIALGVISHVPGGLGVFEASILYMLSRLRRLPPPPLARC